MKRKLSSPMAAAEAPPRDALFDASHKVYLFACVEPMSFKDRDIFVEDVYVFDLNPNAEGNPNPQNSITVSPALRFKSDFPVALIVLDSKLYLFEGYEEFRVDAKSVHVYDLSSASSYLTVEPEVEPEVMLIDKMDSLPAMHGFKLRPSAILTPDRRSVLVFSTFVKQSTINPELADLDFMIGRIKGIVDFELFDLVNESWLQLPSLPELPRASKDEIFIYINSYYFEGMTFVVRTKDSITFSLNLEDLDKGWAWERVCGEAMTPPLYGEVVAVGDALAVAMNRVYDVAGEFCYNVPNPNLKKKAFPTSVMAVLDRCLKGEGGWENQVCVMYLDYETEGDPVMSKGSITVYPEIYIDVYEIKSAPHSGSKFSRPTLAPTKKRSHKFDLSVPYWSFFFACMLPARAATTVQMF